MNCNAYPGQRQGFRPWADQGIHYVSFQPYGMSASGLPLTFLPCREDCWLLVLAGTHGEEPEGTVVLSRALRLLRQAPQHTSVILCANPDGLLLGTRGNSRGVDLNRNFPASNWRDIPVESRLVLEAPRVTRLSPGAAPASEPETRALIDLIQKLSPREVVSLHSPLGCVDCPEPTPLVQRLSENLGLPWVQSPGYETPGSFGSWCEENGLPCITLEFPREPLETLAADYAGPLAELLF
ncbi:MAG TPA: murein tripeptide amidase MpaA [Fibrobacteraceae bacterium]|nr:murein tripeptide amidase MpaA [Fibrobacteraceae bacterium]